MFWELIIFVFAGITVAVGCLVPARWLPPLPNDKLLHFLAFGGLTFLAGRIAHGNAEQVAWLFGLLLAGWGIEVLQNLVPGRKFCWRDMGANAAGISLAAALSQLTSSL